MMNQESILAHVFPEMMNSKHGLRASSIDYFINDKVNDFVNERVLRIADTKQLQCGRIGPEKVGFKMCQGHIKINESQLSVLGMSDFSTVRADCCVYEGKWFYEVRLVSKGVMQLGWCTDKCRFNEENGVGDTQDSYGFDGSRIKLWNVLSRKYGEAWQIGDVIGCGIDLTDGKLEYFRNGKSLGIAYDHVRVGPDIAYFPASSLSLSDNLIFNFGGSRFLYPIEGYQSIQHQNISNLVKAQCIIGYLERLIPITVECMKIPQSGDPQFIFMDLNDDVASKYYESQQLSNQCCCWLIACNLLSRLEVSLKQLFINESCLIPLLLKFCDVSNLKSNQNHINVALDMIWNLLSRESVTVIVDNLIMGILTMYQFSPLNVDLQIQAKYLYLMLAIVKHNKTKLYILENAFFEKTKLPLLMHIRIPRDDVLEQLISGNYWAYPVCVLNDCCKHKLSLQRSPRKEFSDLGLKSQYFEAIHLIQLKIREIEDIQSEILVQFVKCDLPLDDETDLTLRTLFIQELYRFLRKNINIQTEGISDYSSAVILSFFHKLVTLIRHLWKEAMLQLSDLPSFEDISIPMYLYAMPSSNCIQLNSLRIGGRLSQLTKTFKSELDAVLNKNIKKSEKRSFINFKKKFPKFLVDSKNKKQKQPNTINDIILEERNTSLISASAKNQSISTCKVSKSPTKDSCSTSELSINSATTFNFLSNHIRVEPLSLFTGLINRTNSLPETTDDNIITCQLDSVLGELTSCIQLIEAAAAFYHLGANDQFNKMVALRNQAHSLILSICDLDDKFLRCPDDESNIKAVIEESLKIFENKLRLISRDLAFANATTFSEEKRDDILWLWTTTLSTLEECKTDKLYGFLPTYHIENCLNIFKHITQIFHPTLQLEGLRDCSNVLGQHGMILMYNYRDKRIIHANLRNHLMKGIVEVISLPVALKFLEERIKAMDASNFITALLTDWADAMIVLEKFWKGDGFAFRYQELPHQRLPEFHLRDATGKTYEKPNPSKEFQLHLKNVLNENNIAANAFVDLLLTKINWGFSEVVSNMQELNQYKSSRIDRLTDIRFIRTCSLCFDITVSLLRILEMIVTLAPELFVDFSKSHSELFLDRLYSSISQIFNRCLNKGLFHNIVNFKINGLDQLDYFPIISASLGVIVALVIDTPIKVKQISSVRLVEIMTKESNFMQQSIDKIVVKSPPNTHSNNESSSIFTTASDCIFNLSNYSDYINDEEIRKVEMLLELIETQCNKTTDDVNEKDDDLCTICFAHVKSAIFKPCGHSSCKNCITYHMMSNAQCFFCKTKVSKVEDLSGKDLHIKPAKPSSE